MLAASFFFSSFAGSLDRCSKAPFIATLVYQLIQHDSILGLRDEVLAAIDRDPLLFKRNLDAQMGALILLPLRKVFGRSDPRIWPQLVLIDGLDECGGDQDGDGTVQTARKSKEDNHREILSVLVRASSNHSFPFRVIITSRPEQAISRYMSSLPEGTTKEVFLNDKYDPTTDIELFIRAMLVKIGRDHCVPEGWYQGVGVTVDVPHFLAQEASEQFIYAATVIRYVQDGTNTPINQLKHILSSRRPAGSKPFAALDALYTLVLQTSPTPALSVTWICTIDFLMHGHGDTAEPWYIKGLLESSPRESELRLDCLSSLVGLPNTAEPRFTFYHKSLLDFLEDRERSAQFYVEKSDLKQFLLDRYYQILKSAYSPAFVLTAFNADFGTARGSQVYLPPDLLDTFLEAFCRARAYLWMPNFTYDSSDVEWWTAHVCPGERNRDLPNMFHMVHQNVGACSCIADASFAIC